MKQKERRELNVSPNNLIVPSWAKPIPKREKINSIILAIIFAIGLAVIIVFEKNSLTLPTGLAVVIVLIMGVTGFLSLVVPLQALVNKVIRCWHNTNAAKKLLEKE